MMPLSELVSKVTWASDKRTPPREALLRLVLVLGTGLCAGLVPTLFALVTSLVGVLNVSVLCYILPCAFFVQLARATHSTPWTSKDRLAMAVPFALAAVATLIAIFGTTVVMIEIARSRTG